MSWLSNKLDNMRAVHDDNVQRLKGVPVVGQVVQVAEGAAGAVKGAASFSVWLNQHWRLAVVGLVALVVLLKD